MRKLLGFISVVSIAMIVLYGCSKEKPGEVVGEGSVPSFEIGVHYDEIYPAPSKDIKPGRVKVVEMFWYGCPHCYAAEEYVKKWKSTKPEYVDFIRVPAVERDSWVMGAIMFYIAEDLGLTNLAHAKIFDGYHESRKQFHSMDEVKGFFIELGVKESQFNKVLENGRDTFSERIAKSQWMSKEYQISGVPSFIVNDRYIVKADNQSLGAVINFLAEKEKAEGEDAEK